MSLFDNMSLMTAQEEMFNGVTDDLFEKLTDLLIECDVDINDISLEFKDPDFLNLFFKEIPEEDQKKNFITAYNYEHGKEYDVNYLLVFRRAIYTKYAKNESFWSLEFNLPRFGLRKEQPIGSPVRLYSSIMISTMGKLINHGVVELEHGGATDGEVVIDDSKPFNDFLFVYKPSVEKEQLKQYINSGGKTYEEVVAFLNATSEERKVNQGFSK